MELTVNGSPIQIEAKEISLLEFLATRGIHPETRGIAVAVNREFVPRSTWKEKILLQHDVVEIIGARAGG